MSKWIIYFLRFVLLVLLQVLLFDNVQISAYINPFPYVYFIIMLPVNMGRAYLLVVGFLTGLVMDMFSGTGGIHAAACTLIAFYRPFLLSAQSPREGFELNAVPNLRLFGTAWFIGFAALMVGLHHTVLFFLEIFRFADFFHTLLKVILSGVFSLGIILLMEMVTIPDSRRR